MFDQASQLNLQNRENRNRWYEVEKISDRELIIRFPKDDPTTEKVLDGNFRFVLMESDVFDRWHARLRSSLYSGLTLGFIVGWLLGILVGKLNN